MAIQADRTIRLPDGRTLGYAETGDPQGTPVLHFHGSPSCRLDATAPEFDAIAERLGVRVLALDRPGVGLSDPKPNRTILDWPADVLGFAEAVGLSRFSALGVSGGAPYAAACALRIPHRLRSVGIACGVAPMDVPDGRQGMSRQNRTMSFGRGGFRGPCGGCFERWPRWRPLSRRPSSTDWANRCPRSTDRPSRFQPGAPTSSPRFGRRFGGGRRAD